MNSQLPQAYALALAEWHRQKATYQPLPEAHLGDMAFALATQEASIARWVGQGRTIGGWKIGLTSKPMQALCGVSEPIAGAMLADLLRPSGVSLQASAFGRLGLEMELAVCLSEVPPQGANCDAASLVPLVDRVCAAIEVIDDRAADYSRLDACSLVADNSWNQGNVHGQPVHRVDAGLLGRRGTLTCNGVEVSSGMTQDAGGDPLAVVAWLINALRERGRELEPGQWVMTGSIVPTVFPQPGETYRFVIEGLPPVEVAVT